MKKKNLKSLTLNKRKISTFKSNEVQGGLTPLTPWTTTVIVTIDKTIELTETIEPPEPTVGCHSWNRVCV